MPHPDDNILDLDSSSESETLDAGQAQASAEGAESSAAQDAPESDDLLSVVRDVNVCRRGLLRRVVYSGGAVSRPLLCLSQEGTRFFRIPSRRSRSE